MIRKLMIGFLALFLLTAAAFSLVNLTNQKTITEDLQDEAIAAVLKEAEQSLVAATQSSPVDNPWGMGMGHAGEETTADQSEMDHDSTIVSGTVEILSSGVLNVTTADGSVIPVWLGNGALTNLTDFTLEDGNTVTVEGFWSGSGNFMAQTLTNEDTGLVMDLAEITPSETSLASTSTGGQGYGQSGGQGSQGQGTQGAQGSRGIGGGGSGYRGGRN